MDYYNWYVRRDPRYLLILFHAWEFSLAGLALLLGWWHHPIFLAAILGYLGHLTADQLANGLHPMTYSITYRWFRRFDRRRLTRGSLWPLSDVMAANIPFWRQIEP